MKKLCIVIVLFICCTQNFAQITNGNFTQWQNNEPVDWLTNNYYDTDKKPVESFVLPNGNNGIKLIVKKISIDKPDSTADFVYIGGKLTSIIMPQLFESGNPVTLTLKYIFTPDSGDVLKASIELSPRNIDSTGNIRAVCQCQFSNQQPVIETILDKTAGEKSTSWSVRFPRSSNPNLLPAPCRLYAWKIKFWLENSITYLHENTTAFINSVSVQ